MGSIPGRWGGAGVVAPEELATECRGADGRPFSTPDPPPGGPAAEAALLRAGQAGDLGALERLVTLHKRSLYALCRGILANAEDAEDAAQETFLRALRALPRFRGDATFRTWLFRIAVNVCLQWKAAARREADTRSSEPWDEDDPSSAPETASPERIALRHLQVTEALRSLLPRHRAILLLRELEGWSVPEIAAALHWNEKRVRNELYKARRALADWRRNAAEGDER
jgi:RNA polymerase sigma-70 factor, ECF subfamily